MLLIQNHCLDCCRGVKTNLEFKKSIIHHILFLYLLYYYTETYLRLKEFYFMKNLYYDMFYYTLKQVVFIYLIKCGYKTKKKNIRFLKCNIYLFFLRVLNLDKAKFYCNKIILN